MLTAALGALAVLIAAARIVYPRVVERRAGARRRLGKDGIIEGAAAIDLPRESAPAVLLLHGGGDTPQVLADLAVHLHERGFAVRVPLLSRHGRALSSLALTSATELHGDVNAEYEALRAKHEWVAVVGLSVGGALAIVLAASRQDVPALVLLAPYVSMPGMVRHLARTSRLWGWATPYFSSRGEASIKDPDAAARTLGYGIMTPAALRAFFDISTAAAQALPRVRVPTRVIQSREDNRISRESAESAFALLGSSEKDFVWVEGAGHVITVDFGRERVYELTSEWLEARRPAVLGAVDTGTKHRAG